MGTSITSTAIHVDPDDIGGDTASGAAWVNIGGGAALFAAVDDDPDHSVAHQIDRLAEIGRRITAAAEALR